MSLKASFYLSSAVRLRRLPTSKQHPCHTDIFHPHKNHFAAFCTSTDLPKCSETSRNGTEERRIKVKVTAGSRRKIPLVRLFTRHQHPDANFKASLIDRFYFCYFKQVNYFVNMRHRHIREQPASIYWNFLSKLALHSHDDESSHLSVSAHGRSKTSQSLCIKGASTCYVTLCILTETSTEVIVSLPRCSY